MILILNYEQYLSCSVGPSTAEPIDVWARVEVGTRWMVAVVDAGCGRHGHAGGESLPPFAPDYGNNHRSCHEQLFVSGLCLILENYSSR